MQFKKGSKVKMTPEAVENYGEIYAGKTLIVTHAAHSYMPANEFFSRGKPEGYHPGYDEGVKGQGLYDLKLKNGEALPFSLYDWELIPN